MGVFDTVASIGLPDLNSEIRPEKTVLFENNRVCEKVKKAAHLLSIDDRRKAFQPALMNHEIPRHGEEPRIEEIWFAGTHSDVGGGYHNNGLSDCALEFMLEKVKENQLGIEILHAATLDYDTLVPSQETRVKIEYADLHSQPGPCGLTHEQDRPFLTAAATLDDRQVRVDIKDDKSTIPPMLHHSVLERLQTLRDYKPLSLKALEHRIVGMPGTYKGHSEHKAARIPLSEPLEKQEEKTTRVYANRKYTSSHILIEEGAGYVFSVDKNEKWYDATIDCNYEGWSLDNGKIEKRFGFLKRLFIKAKRNNRRVPDAKWFELCAAVGKDDSNAIRIRDHISDAAAFISPYTGEFYPFANDLESMYHNNMGYIDLFIKRIA